MSKTRKCQECKRRSAIVKLNAKWVCLKCFEAKLDFFNVFLKRMARRLSPISPIKPKNTP